MKYEFPITIRIYTSSFIQYNQLKNTTVLHDNVECKSADGMAGIKLIACKDIINMAMLSGEVKSRNTHKTLVHISRRIDICDIRCMRQKCFKSLTLLFTRK